MENIINKYKGERGMVRNLFSLYKELSNTYSKHIALEQIKNLLNENTLILKKIKKDNKELENIISSRNIEIINNEYVKSETTLKQKPIKTNNIDIDNSIKFYTTYIEQNLIDNTYLNILPKTNDKESIEILIKILSYFKSKISLYEYFLSTEIDENEIYSLSIDLSKYYSIYNTIIEYKNNLKVITSTECNEFKNKISYFMSGDVPYIYKDIENNPESFDTVLKLIESIENGTFKNIESFTNKLKGLLEVRNLSKQIRVIFELDHDTYCIIGAILSKSETNSIHQEKLRNRYNIYKQNKLNSKSDNNILKKILKGN